MKKILIGFTFATLLWAFQSHAHALSKPLKIYDIDIFITKNTKSISEHFIANTHDPANIKFIITKQPSIGHIINNNDGTFTYLTDKEVPALKTNERCKVTVEYQATRHQEQSTINQITINISSVESDKNPANKTCEATSAPEKISPSTVVENTTTTNFTQQSHLRAPIPVNRQALKRELTGSTTEKNYNEAFVKKNWQAINQQKVATPSQIDEPQESINKPQTDNETLSLLREETTTSEPIVIPQQTLTQEELDAEPALITPEDQPAEVSEFSTSNTTPSPETKTTKKAHHIAADNTQSTYKFGKASIPTGPFVGLGYGINNYRDACDAIGLTSCDHKDKSYKIFGGYWFNKYFGAELALTDLGESKLKAPFVESRIKMRGISTFALARLPIVKNLATFLKLGAIYWKGERKTIINIPPPINFSAKDKVTDKGINLAYGIGIEYFLADHLILRGELEEYENLGEGRDRTGNTNARVWSLGLGWIF